MTSTFNLHLCHPDLSHYLLQSGLLHNSLLIVLPAALLLSFSLLSTQQPERSFQNKCQPKWTNKNQIDSLILSNRKKEKKNETKVYRHWTTDSQECDTQQEDNKVTLLFHQFISQEQILGHISRSGTLNRDCSLADLRKYKLRTCEDQWGDNFQDISLENRELHKENEKILQIGQEEPLSWLSTDLCTVIVVVLLSCVRLFANPWTVGHQAPLSMGFPRQEN